MREREPPLDRDVVCCLHSFCSVSAHQLFVVNIVTPNQWLRPVMLTTRSGQIVFNSIWKRTRWNSVAEQKIISDSKSLALNLMPVNGAIYPNTKNRLMFFGIHLLR